MVIRAIKQISFTKITQMRIFFQVCFALKKSNILSSNDKMGLSAI
jgi:hypothetical protein